MVGAVRPGQDEVEGHIRVRTSVSSWWPSGKRKVTAPAWRISLAGTWMSPVAQGGDHGLATWGTVSDQPVGVGRVAAS